MRRRGTTLLETLVALAITALVMAAVAGVVRGAARTRAAATGTADRVALGRTVLVRLAAEIEAAVRPLAGEDAAVSPTFALRPPSPEAPPWATLRFLTATAGGTGLGALRYRVEPDRAEPGRGTLTRAEATRPPTAGTLEPAGVGLVDGVRAFRIRCFDGTAWSSDWQPGVLPRAVEITLAVDDGHGSEELTTMVTLAAAER